MSAELSGVVLGHGPLAEAMVAAAESIAGIRGALVPVSNSGCDRAVLEERLRTAIDGRPCLVFVDLPTGSCFVAAMKALNALSGIRVVTGVNLTMLLDFLFHRDLPLDAAAARAGEIGIRAIGDR